MDAELYNQYVDSEAGSEGGTMEELYQEQENMRIQSRLRNEGSGNID